MDAGMVQEQHEGINYSNIIVVLATPMMLMLGMLFTATDPDQAPAVAPAAAVAAAAAALAPADELAAELRRRGHTEAGAALIAARVSAAVPDPVRRRELALLASQFTTSLRLSDEEATARALAEAMRSPEPARR